MILSVFLFCGFLIFCPISDAIVENRPYAFDRFFRWMWGSFDRFVFNGKSTLLGFSRGLSELVIFHDSPIAPKCWFPPKNWKKTKEKQFKKNAENKKSFFFWFMFIYLFMFVDVFLFESSVESLFSSCFYFGSFCFSDVLVFFDSLLIIVCFSLFLWFWSSVRNYFSQVGVGVPMLERLFYQL